MPRPVLLAGLALLLPLALSPGAAAQQGAASGSGATLRALDKITGEITDIDIARGQMKRYGQLRILLGDCRYPTDNPTSDAYALLEIRDTGQAEPAFRGWMVASSPALHALDHPRYDVWVLRCTRS
jgi:hypothetical protein